MADACLIEFLEHGSLADAAEVVATEAATWLGYCALGGPASVALPGYASPQIMLEKMADVPIAWDRVTVTTTDEHRVPDGHPLSNIGTVQRAFRGRWGAQARFISLDRPDAARQVKQPLDLVILSLAADGRIACLPACSEGGAETTTPLVDFKYRPSVIEMPVASRRWDFAALLSSQRTLLVAAGTTSRDVIERALSDQSRSPLGAWFGRAKGLVTIHWTDA